MKGSLRQLTRDMFYQVITPCPTMKMSRIFRKLKIKGDIDHVITTIKGVVSKK